MTEQVIDDDRRRRVLEQLCKGRSFAFAAGVTQSSSSLVASIAEAAGWPDDEARARREWLHLQRTFELQGRATREVTLPTPRPTAPEPLPVPARFVAPRPAPEPAPVVAPDPVPVIPIPVAFVDPDTITAEAWRAAHIGHGCECGPDGCGHGPVCYQCADSGVKGWGISWPCDGVLAALSIQAEDYVEVDARLSDAAIAAQLAAIDQATTEPPLLLVAPERPADPLDQAQPAARALILAHAAAPVIAAVRAGKLTPGHIANVIRDVLPRHRRTACAACRSVQEPGG